MPRIYKANKPEVGYAHREHRSKKGRKYNPEKPFTVKYKKRKEELKYGSKHKEE